MQLRHPNVLFALFVIPLRRGSILCSIKCLYINLGECLLESFIRETPLLSPCLSSTSIKGRSSLCTGTAKWLHQGFTCTFWTTCSVFKTSQLQHFRLLRAIHVTVKCSCGSVCSPNMFGGAGQELYVFNVGVHSRSLRAGAAVPGFG